MHSERHAEQAAGLSAWAVRNMDQRKLATFTLVNFAAVEHGVSLSACFILIQIHVGESHQCLLYPIPRPLAGFMHCVHSLEQTRFVALCNGTFGRVLPPTLVTIYSSRFRPHPLNNHSTNKVVFRSDPSTSPPLLRV